ncbi:MAG: molybdopterin-dependent oxidoreductase [Holophagaceae bacterium]|nr:molybdopterin-dependent oxidoreductase [Holophagaceae bacterium]
MQVVADARKAGAKDNAAIIASTVDRLKKKDLRFSVEDPDASENWPRIWFIWRGNGSGTSAKGHEFFLKHCLEPTPTPSPMKWPRHAEGC